MDVCIVSFRKRRVERLLSRGTRAMQNFPLIDDLLRGENCIETLEYEVCGFLERKGVGEGFILII